MSLASWSSRWLASRNRWVRRGGRCGLHAWRAVRRQIRRARYRGRRHQCPCCQEWFRAFMPHGRRSRSNARCPSCGALERHRLLWLFLAQRTALLRAELRVLHFAPEPAFAAALSSQPNLHYVTTDLRSPDAGVWGDICRCPFADGSFDVVLCSHVLEHVPDDRGAMAELFRILRPGGWGIIEVPMDEARETTFEDANVASAEERLRLFGQEDHVRIYGRDYFQRLRDAGFDVRLDRFAERLTPECTATHLVQGSRPICLCSKPAPRGAGGE